MPLPVPNLDDRRFEDLVAEARARLATHLPELTQLAPGDPVHNFIELFAWLTETILYRANLIPERQRRVFLNLLQIPVRPAQPAVGVACIGTGPRSVRIPPVVPAGLQLTGAGQTFTTVGEVQPTPLELSVAIKQTLDAEDLQALGLTLDDLHEQYALARGEIPAPFQPHVFDVPREPLSLVRSLDKVYYVAFSVPRTLVASIDEIRAGLAGIVLNIAIAPDDADTGESVSDLRARALDWTLMVQGQEGEILSLPLEVVHDSSLGGRRAGVARLRLPRNPALFQGLTREDPMFAGLGELPPELPTQIAANRIVFWVRLGCAEEPDLPLGYLDVNGVDIVGQGLKRDLMVGIGNGRPDQVVVLPDTQIDAGTLELTVAEEGAWVPWQRVDFLAGHGPEDRVFRLDAVAGHVHFGNGENGKRPPEGHRIRVAAYRFGGGREGNLPPGSLTELTGASSRLVLRQDWPTRGGVDAETVEQAEQRIPQFLTHRNRAVTRDDFRLLTLANPINPVARCEVLEGFLPGASIRAVREGVPGVVSLFVLPPGEPALNAAPRPTQGLLKDVFNYLRQRLLIGTELYVLSPEFVPVAVSVKISVHDVQTEQQTLRAVREALIRYLWALAPGGAQGEGWPLGAAVRGRELLTQAARAPGVREVNALAVFVRVDGHWRRLELDEPLDLAAYQLPELVGIGVGSGTGTPGLPEGLAPAPGGGGGRPVPAPVIPDVC
ncbi:putative baseplate assembly protein [Thioalkalivibrio paradoxus]|uniref:Uncharacterized protein n=1 Tax=Thioalkalivibrio paradoxus ARh 1 TaxID=713585 RepID=W0DJL2_9GAMM|nr:putative baseplate assembly protein [Thioalkalivibrio paradoxus]AHE97432.1 hypothetical protein THITH_03135 [Thioalkalivibrio paradoxus ARh 1]